MSKGEGRKEYFHLNWYSVVDAITTCREYDNCLVYLKNKNGDIHKVFLEITSPKMGVEVFNVTINDASALETQKYNAGEVYDYLMEELTL